jgi:hypothetical protein
LSDKHDIEAAGLADYSKDVCRIATVLEKRDEIIDRLRADNKALLDAAKGVKKLLEEPSPFYLKKLGGSITDGDQKQIDDVFIALDAAIEHSEPQ